MEDSKKAEKSNKSQKPINFKAKYITLGIMVAVLVAAIVLFIVFNNREEDAKAYMTMQTNPSVQLVLDANNKVVGQVALNDDGDKVLAVVSFKGLSAEDAAKLFAQTATEMDKMNTSGGADATTGTQVNIQIAAEKTADYEKLATSVKETVNKYFADNGIFAGAATNLSNDVVAAAKKMALDTADFAHMTTQEIMNYTKTSASEMEKMTHNAVASAQSKCTELYNSVLATVDAAFTTAEKELNEAKDNLAKMTDSASKKVYQTVVDGCQTAYDSAKKTYDQVKADFEKRLNEAINKIKTETQQAYDTMKTQAETAYNSSKAKIEETLAVFKEKTAEAQATIKDNIGKFQATLTFDASAIA